MITAEIHTSHLKWGGYIHSGAVGCMSFVFLNTLYYIITNTEQFNKQPPA